MTDPKNIILLVVFCIFSLSAFVQLFYYLFFYLSLNSKKSVESAETRGPVSIIICARNEAENLGRFLPSVLEQDYPDYEVIVVNDCSEDNSYNVLAELRKKYPHLKISTLNKDPQFTHFKKFAQFIGIKAAKNEILLFTDADCHPESKKWLEGMVSGFDDKTNFILGYGGYTAGRGLLNKYIRFDTMFIAMQYLGMAIRRVPYMGVGRNLSYRRSVFFKNKGFGAYNHLVSGDDDLLVNTLGNGTNTKVEFRPETHTRSVSATSFNEWIIQKKRHLTTAPYYKFSDKLLLVTEPLTRMIFYAAFIVLLSFLYLWPWVLCVFAIRLGIQFTVLSIVRKKLKEPELIPYFLPFDILSPLINSIIYLSNNRLMARKNRWK
jgi:poly-beta-1,6-N-acetyl-D-glucosamine synthase